MRMKMYVFVTVLLFFTALSGCSDKSGLLVKTWTVNELKYTSEVPDEMKPTIENSVNEMRQYFRLTYRNDGTYMTQMKDQKLEGKWKLNWNSTKLTSTDDRGIAKDFKVTVLNENEFEFEADEAGEKVIFVMIPVEKQGI